MELGERKGQRSRHRAHRGKGTEARRLCREQQGGCSMKPKRDRDGHGGLLGLA